MGLPPHSLRLASLLGAGAWAGACTLLSASSTGGLPLVLALLMALWTRPMKSLLSLADEGGVLFTSTTSRLASLGARFWFYWRRPRARSTGGISRTGALRGVRWRLGQSSYSTAFLPADRCCCAPSVPLLAGDLSFLSELYSILAGSTFQKKLRFQTQQTQQFPDRRPAPGTFDRSTRC